MIKQDYIPVKTIFKKIVLTLILSPVLLVEAQFTGGDGDGDSSLTVSGITLSGETLTLYRGGNGKGDNLASATSVFLSEDVLYQGGNGRGDVALISALLSLGDDMRFSGGSGDGDGSAGIAGKVLSQRILWRGGGGVGNDSASNQASNWFPNSIPGANDEIALEDTANGIDLMLAQNMRIKSLDFNGAGKIVKVGNYSLVITDQVYGADASNYIQTNGSGCVRFFVPDNEFRLMPVGLGAYNPVTITNKTGVLDSFCVYVVDEIYSRGTWGRPLWNVPRVSRTWYISKGSGTSNLGNGVDFDFQYNAGEDSAVNSMNLFHWNGNNWSVQTGGSLTGGVFSFVGYKGNFSPFALGDGVSPLPVSWLDMRCARKEGQGVEVKWKTASEENSQSFFIQRSTGGAFTDIDSVPAAGYSYEPKSYTYTDRAAPFGTLFYRIRQLDRDGTQSFSDVCASSQASAASLKIMNNPADQSFNIWITEALSGSAYRLINPAGQVVGSGVLGTGVTEVPTASLPSGCYSFQIMNAENPFFTKVVVLHP
jgi:hypothetical protein